MGGQLGKNFWTFKLSNDTILIDKTFGLTTLSLELVSGTGTIQGNLVCSGIASEELDLSIGQPVLITTDNLSLIDNWTISTTGVIQIIGR